MAIARIIGDDRYADELRAAGTARAAQFSWQRCAAETAAIYRQLAR